MWDQFYDSFKEENKGKVPEEFFMNGCAEHDLANILMKVDPSKFKKSIEQGWQTSIAKGFKWSHNDYGMFLFKEGRTDEAVDQFKKGIKVHDIFAFNKLGDLYFNQGRYDEAFLCYLEAGMNAGLVGYTSCTHNAYGILGGIMDNLYKIKPYLTKSVNDLIRGKFDTNVVACLRCQKIRPTLFPISICPECLMNDPLKEKRKFGKFLYEIYGKHFFN